MEQIKIVCRDIRNNIVGHLDPLEGTDYDEVSNRVKIELERGLQDICNIFEGYQEADTSNFKGFEYLLRDGDRYVVCGLVTMLTGEGAKV